jgi:hypothetical protein
MVGRRDREREWVYALAKSTAGNAVFLSFGFRFPSGGWEGSVRESIQEFFLNGQFVWLLGWC